MLSSNYNSSLVIDRLYGLTDVRNTAVACVYCDFHAQNEQTATGLFGALLNQVVSALEPIPEKVQKAFKNSKGGAGGRRLLLAEILEVLAKSLSRLRKVFICIDALDEFPEKHRPELWESLQQIVQKCPNTRLFLTGRLHIRGELEKYFPRTAEMLPISPRENDIGLYLNMRLNRCFELSGMDKELEADILRIIPEVVSGTYVLFRGIPGVELIVMTRFLLVSLNMDTILAEATTHQKRQALLRVPQGLGLQDAYHATLDRIKQQGGSKARLGMEALMWISRSERPLGSRELCHALGVELGEEDFAIQNIPSIQTVLGFTLGLVTINEQASTPRLVHFTLQEYLEQDPTLFVKADSMMAEICLTYLNCRLVWALPPNPEEARETETAQFLEYATCFWGTHAARGVTEQTKSLALRLLNRYENHVSAVVLWRGGGCARGTGRRMF